MSGKKVHRIQQVQGEETEGIFRKNLDKLVELQKGIKILKVRMSASKTDLLTYFEKHPQLQNSKYIVNDYSVRFVNKKTTDGMSQKLIMVGLAQYFKSKGVTDVSKEVSQVMSIIRNQRHSKIVSGIDIKSLQKSSDSDDDNEEATIGE